MYCITAAAYILPIPFFKRFVHNFWLLQDSSSGEIIAELQGLATSRKRNVIVPIGFKKDHCLRAYHLIRNPEFAKQRHDVISEFQLPHHLTQSIYAEKDALDRWLQAVAKVVWINQLDLDYPRGGFCLPVKKTCNSNTIYRTFADIMGIEAYKFPGYINLGLNQTLNR